MGQCANWFCNNQVGPSPRFRDLGSRQHQGIQSVRTWVPAPSRDSRERLEQGMSEPQQVSNTKIGALVDKREDQ